MNPSLKILLLEDNKTDAEIIARELLKSKNNFEFKYVPDKKRFLQALEEFNPDVILSDNSLPDIDASTALGIISQKQIRAPFILVTGTVSEEFAVSIMKQGVDDYILKDRLTRLPAAIEAALQKRKHEKEINDYKYALDKSADVTITDQKGVIIYANENFCKIYGYTEKELIGQDHRIINSRYHPSSFIRNLWVTIANGNIWRDEIRNKAKDGSFHWADTMIIPFLDRTEKPYQYLSIRRDITPRKKAQEELLQTQKRLIQAQEIAHLGNWELNFETNRTKWSDEAYKIYGLEPGDHNLSFEDWLGFIHPDDIEYVKMEIEKSQATLSDLSFHHRIIRKNGIVRHIYSQSKYEFNKAGKPIGLYGIAHDVTDIKLLEEKLREQQKQEQVKITTTALEAQEKERNAIGQELHDNVNQILVGTKMILSMAKKDPENAKELISSCINNLQDAIDENRKIAHVMVAPNLESGNLVTQITKLADAMLATADLKVQIDNTGFKEELLDDSKKINIYRIAQEQCTNIIKHSQAKTVKILLATDSKSFSMQIADDGVGMVSDKKIDGIGLRNIYGRLSIFNGKATVTTAPGQGFKLEVIIPI